MSQLSIHVGLVWVTSQRSHTSHKAIISIPQTDFLIFRYFGIYSEASKSRKITVIKRSHRNFLRLTNDSLKRKLRKTAKTLGAMGQDVSFIILHHPMDIH